jgi:glycosyltransferase involved in cell wall biosynthesis
MIRIRVSGGAGIGSRRSMASPGPSAWRAGTFVRADYDRGVNGDRRPARVLLACSGLEHAKRGFESFARECFEELRDEPSLDLRLVKGTGPDRERERSVPSLTRYHPLARALARVWGDPIRVEQLAFALSLQREVHRRRPDVIYLSEWFTGVGLAAARRVNRQNYALVLSNGSMAGTGFEPFDRVHQHTAPALEYVLAKGADPAKHILLPVAFRLPAIPEVPSEDDRLALRTRFDLPRDRRIVISVAALNRWHKRLDYVIEEVARLPEPRPFLLLVGAPEAETDGLRALARGLLGEDGHSLRTVPREDVDPLLDASDVFVLASLVEGLPRGLVEALAHGLPCLAHDYPIADYALGPHGHLADFRQPGALAGLLQRVDDAGADRAQQHRFVYERFSWDVLRPQYVDLLCGAVGRADFGSPG